MRATWLAVAVAGTLVVGSALAQGPGYGRGAGRGAGGAGRGAGAGVCIGLGPGAGAGGWWTRVVPTTPAQKAFVAAVTNLHAQIRQANLDLAALQASNAPATQIAAKQQQIAGLRTELQRVTAANQALLKQMGVPAGCGVCDGTGPKGPGRGAGQGMGRGMGRGAGQGAGRGLRDGTGPNPSCPLKPR